MKPNNSRYARPALVIGSAITIITAAVAYCAPNRAHQAAPSVRTSGIIEGHEVSLASRAAGRIVHICCKEGDRVEKSQLIVRLESDDLRAAVDQARADVQRAQAGIGVARSSVRYAHVNIEEADAAIQTAQADVDKAAAQHNDAVLKLNRVNVLRGQGLVSQDMQDTAKTFEATTAAEYASARSRFLETTARKKAAFAQLAVTENQLMLAESELKHAQAGLAYSEARLADTLIESPMAGTVVFQSLEQGELAPAGMTIISVVAIDDLYVKAYLDETLIGGIALGDPATISAEASLPQQFHGRVSEIGRYAEFATQRDVGQGRNDIRTFRVKIDLEDGGDVLKPGMTVDVDIATGKRRPS